MRIISGTYKGKRLIAPQKLPVRPTTDFAKEALFNILNNLYHFQDIVVTELFAGTGNISFEFASRGVKEITAVDANAGCIQFIDKISGELDFNIRTVKSDVFSFLKKISSTSDIVFADPPYEFTAEKFAEIHNMVFTNSLLTENGTLIIEHSKHTDLSMLPNFKEARKYGGTVFSFFEKEA